MKEALKGLFGSKKALAGVAGVATTALILFAQKNGYGLDPEATKLLVLAVLGLSGLFITGQGVADWGKEAAKVQAASYAVMDSAHRLDELEVKDLKFEDADEDDAEDDEEDAEPEVLTED